MAERIRRIQHGRRVRSEPLQHAPTCEQISDECFPARNELIGEHIPRPCLERSVAQCGSEIVNAFGADCSVVVEDNLLAVQQEWRSWRLVIEQLIDERNELLPKAPCGEIPLAI